MSATAAQAAAQGPLVLLVEDEHSLGQLVRGYLQSNGYRVVWTTSGEEALVELQRHDVRMVVLDIGLPGMDGFDVCKRIRARSSVPIVMLTARDEEPDRVAGLEVGADDYVTKPFSPRELVARIKAVLRRTESAAAPPPAVLRLGAVVVDTGRREVTLDGRPVGLTTREFDLLRYLGEHAGLALSRQQLLDGVWGHGWFGDPRTVDVHIAQVRKKLDDRVAITTVRGVGYRLDADASPG
jgi:DNA-binding response OmpR family regulator